MMPIIEGPTLVPPSEEEQQGYYAKVHEFREFLEKKLLQDYCNRYGKYKPCKHEDNCGNYNHLNCDGCPFFHHEDSENEGDPSRACCVQRAMSAMMNLGIHLVDQINERPSL